MYYKQKHQKGPQMKSQISELICGVYSTFEQQTQLYGLTQMWNSFKCREYECSVLFHNKEYLILWRDEILFEVIYMTGIPLEETLLEKKYTLFMVLLL